MLPHLHVGGHRDVSRLPPPHRRNPRIVTPPPCQRATPPVASASEDVAASTCLRFYTNSRAASAGPPYAQDVATTAPEVAATPLWPSASALVAPLLFSFFHRVRYEDHRGSSCLLASARVALHREKRSPRAFHRMQAGGPLLHLPS
jgi:hypothetical protein